MPPLFHDRQICERHPSTVQFKNWMKRQRRLSSHGPQEALGALDIVLSPADISAIEVAITASAVAGTRYDEDGMRMFDSER